MEKLPKDYTIEERKQLFICSTLLSIAYAELNLTHMKELEITSMYLSELLNLYDFENNYVAATPGFIDNYGNPLHTMCTKQTPEQFMQQIKIAPEYSYYLYSIYIHKSDNKIRPLICFAKKKYEKLAI